MESSQTYAFRVEQVDHPDELGLAADGQHHHEGLGREDVLHLLDDAVEVRAQARSSLLT